MSQFDNWFVSQEVGVQDLVDSEYQDIAKLGILQLAGISRIENNLTLYFPRNLFL